MLALIGGGVDVSRSYMAKTQLQSACDAGVLAGRRAMSKSGDYGTAEQAKASAMFNFNFDAGHVGATGVTYSTEDNEDGQVLGTATATVPTIVMKVFDKDQINLQVNCMAELQIGNADVMFVLDTTGSMGDPINQGEDSKIDGLRDAVRDFHRTINQAMHDNRTRVRYGFVPYSQTVNISELVSDGDLPLDYLVDSHRYQTRVGHYNTPTYVGTTTTVEDREYYTENGNKVALSSSNCTSYGTNKYPDSKGSNPVSSGTSPSDVIKITYSDGKRDSGTASNRPCSRKRKIETTTYKLKYSLTKWRYERVNLDVSSFKNGGTIPVATEGRSATVDVPGAYNMIELAAMNGSTASGMTVSNSKWSGCIEERDTVTNATFNPIPDAAYDLDLDAEPTSGATRWRPQWGALVYGRDDYDFQEYFWKLADSKFYKNANFTGNSLSAPSAKGNTCPSPMSLFRTVALSDDDDEIPDWLNTYVNNLNATGNTYHDIGMLWGGRLTSPTGLFAENVNLDNDKISVSKHIIFMTDGIMQPSASVYSAYGVESLDSRIAPKGSSGTITARHNARFAAMCNEIKAQGTTIWVVAFGTSMTTQLENCASGGRHYYSSNTEALRSTFRFIAAQVADLRLGS